MRDFRQVDVFTRSPLRGNPVAVVLDGDGLSDDEMATFANWMNLSETTFVLPPTAKDADYRVRIFTPVEELPFAGHPTLGTCHAWLEAGGQPNDEACIVQECGAGLIDIRRDEPLAFAAPPLVRSGPVDEATGAFALQCLNLDASEVEAMAWVDNGPGWLGIRMQDANDLLGLTPADLGDLKIGIVAPLDDDDDADFEVRAFFGVGQGTREDPVTGSLNAALAQWMLAEGLVTEGYTARQGTALGREGYVKICPVDDDRVWVGGDTVTVLSGTISI